MKKQEFMKITAKLFLMYPNSQTPEGLTSAWWSHVKDWNAFDFSWGAKMAAKDSPTFVPSLVQVEKHYRSRNLKRHVLLDQLESRHQFSVYEVRDAERYNFKIEVTPDQHNKKILRPEEFNSKSAPTEELVVLSENYEGIF